MKFSDIPKLTRQANYVTNQPWRSLQRTLNNFSDEEAIVLLDMNPDFQRDYVWTQAQKIAFIEFGLKGGISGMDLFFNCPGWMKDFKGPYVIVDGKQRLNAVLEFINNKLAILKVIIIKTLKINYL